MSSDVFIYGLIDTRPGRVGELRYVGQAQRGLKTALRMHTAKCGSWQKAVHELGLQEEVWVIEEWDGRGEQKAWLNEAETFYVSYFRMIGCDLTNMTPGGDGLPKGYKHTPEARERMRVSKIGIKYGPMSDVRKRKLSAVLMGWKAPGRPRVPDVQLRCGWCGETFEVLHSSLAAKRGWGYCSRSCASKSRFRKVEHEIE